MLSGRALARMVYNRFEILKALYPDREYTMTDLSGIAGIDLGNLSKQINGTKKIVGLLEVELPSGETLIDVREEERERGRPLKYVKLTEAGRKIISPMIEALRPKLKKKELADIEEIDFYLDKMNAPSNDEVLKMAAEQFMTLCGEYIVTHHKRVLPFLKEKLEDSKYKLVHVNLLYSLHLIVQNTHEKVLSETKLKFEEPLKELASNIALEQSSDGSTLRLYAIETLLDILGREDAPQVLMNLYTDGIRERSKLIGEMRSMMLSRYPGKEFEVRKALFEMLKDPREDVRRRIRDQIRELRKPLSYKASKMARYTVVNQNRKVEV